jgi:uncharacterized protein (UPF0218 family)
LAQRIHDFFAVIAMTAKISKQLPSALNTLLAIVDWKFTREQIEQAIEDKTINTFSDAGHIKKLATKLGLAKAKTKAEAAVEAIAAGIREDDIKVVPDISDADMIRMYANENATQRGNTGTAIAGTVASAIKYLAKALLTGDRDSREIARVYPTAHAFEQAGEERGRLPHR